ncbi:MAG: WD40 repeat domain-containing protein [Archangium sp.]
MATRKKKAESAPPLPAFVRLGQQGGLVGKSTITALALSANNRFAVTGDIEGVIRVFDLTTDSEVGFARITRRLRKYDRVLNRVTVANDGKRITAADRGGSLFCGQIGDDDLDFTDFRALHGDNVLSCADGSRVAYLTGGLVLCENGKRVWEDSEARAAQDFAIAPDGRIAVVHHEPQTERGFIRLFDGKASCKLLASVEIPNSCWYARIGFVGNERIVVIAQTGELFFWNGKKGGAVETRQSRFGKSDERPTVLGPLGFFISRDKVFTFDDAAPREVTRRKWACALDGSVVLGENGARIERIGPDLLLPTSTAALNGWVRAIAFEPDQRFVWTADDAAAHRWSLPSGTIDKSIPLPKDHSAHGISNDARVLLLRTHEARSEMQQLFDLQNGKLLHARVKTHSRTSGLSPDGRFFAYGVGGKDVAHVLDVESGKVVRTLTARSPRTPYNAVPSAEGRFVITVNNRYEMVTFDERGKELGSFQRPPGVVMSMRVSKSGKWFVFGRDNAHHLEAWTLAGRQLEPNFTGLRRNDVDTLALSDDEKWVAASDGVAIGIWRFADRKRVLAIQEGAGALAFSSDAKQLAAGGNGTAFVLANFA